MLRVKFNLEPSGYIAAVRDAFPEGRSVELDNAIYVDDTVWMEHLTSYDVAAEGDPAARVKPLDGCAVIGVELIRDDVHVVALANEPEPFLLSTIARVDAIPHRIFVRNGRLTVIASVRDWDHLKDLAETVEDFYDGFELLGTSQSDRVGFPLGGHGLNHTLHGKLTDRQLQVLRTAFEMGYFQVPQEAHASEIADHLEISQGTLSEQLRKAQHVLLSLCFGVPE